MRFTLLAFTVFLSTAICKKENDNDGFQKRYMFNHPPSAEDENNPIPVEEVEDDAISLKILKPNAEEGSKIEVFNDEISHNTEEPVLVENVETSTEVKNNLESDISIGSKVKTLSDLQIPVAVVYDSAPDKIKNTRLEKNNNNPRRRYKQSRRLKQHNKTTETTIEYLKPMTSIQNTELVKPQPRELKSFKSQTQRTETVRQNPSSIETNTKGKITKREREAFVPIVESENYVYSHSGNFHYSYESGDGTKAHSEGQLLRSVDDKPAGEAVTGGFSYTDNEGNDFSLSYTADENGYRPTGAHIPTPPPIPPAIARALAYLATATTAEPVTKPSVKQT